MNNYNNHFARLDEAHFPPFLPNTVWLVGAGPGAPGLLSLLGYYALGQADIIIHDALVNSQILKMANPDAKLIYAGKRGGKPSTDQGDICKTMIANANEGKRVLRLKGGDPFMFGRGGEECLALADAGIKFRLVPGISAGIGGLAYAGIPLTMRQTNHSAIFLTGHDESGTMPSGVDWQKIASASPVIVMFMAVKHLGSITKKLLQAGRKPDEMLAIVSNASLPEQTIVESSLGGVEKLLEENEIATPAIVIVGPVNSYRKTIDWFSPEKEPELFRGELGE
ncbi:MAG: uroporphyrinogen-III C-methyltransferase [Devosiaceae bacterium]|nr:uroporphyrinogen-III C-methyltransferase [Devosiaceae bacterium]